MPGLTGEWQEALKEEFSKDYYRKLFLFIREQYNKVLVFPPADEIFTAFHLTPLNKVKAVLIGQDPWAFGSEPRLSSVVGGTGSTPLKYRINGAGP